MTKAKPKATKTATYEINEGKDEKFRFLIRDAEGKLLAMSGPSGFETKADALKALDAQGSVAQGDREEVSPIPGGGHFERRRFARTASTLRPVLAATSASVNRPLSNFTSAAVHPPRSDVHRSGIACPRLASAFASSSASVHSFAAVAADPAWLTR